MRGELSTRYGGIDGNFNGVLYQQGRVFLDTDGNAQTRITNAWQDAAGLDVIGPGVAAVPADAPDSFRIDAANLAGGGVTLTVHPGRVWADGLLVRLDETLPITRVATYLQPPIQDPPFDETTIGAGVRDAVVLELWRSEVNAFQIPDTLIEPALGGVDTTERVSTAMRFRLFRLGPGDDCDSIGANLADDFSQKGKLRVTLQPTTVTAGDCPVVEGGGYAGFEHHLFRIEIAETTGPQRMFKWSRDNGGLVGRGVFDGAALRVTVTANLTPIVSSGLTDFYLEAVEWDAAQGRWRVTYGAEVTLAGDQLVLPAAATLGAIPAPGAAVFFRLWDGIRALSDFPVSANPTELLDGIRLEFEADAPGKYIPEDYWTFPVRAGEIGNPQVLVDSTPPEGIHHHRVPLAVLDWIGSPDLTAAEGTIEDCRRTFQPLTRVRTCCTYRVGDGLTSHGDYQSIQAALDHLPAEGGEICVLPGLYLENVVVDGRVGVKISGCGTRSRVVCPPPAERAADPVFHVRNSSGIRLENLAIEADATGIGLLLEGQAGEVGDVDVGARGGVRDVALVDLSIQAATRSAIECRDCQQVLIRDSKVSMADTATTWPGIFFIGQDGWIERNTVRVSAGEDPPSEGTPVAARGGLGGIQLGGACQRVRVLENLVQGGVGNGVTLGSVSIVDDVGDDTGALIGWVVNADDPCNPCRPGDIVIVVPVGGDDGTRLVSAGPLEDISIAGNRILDMGLNGIGVIGFFDLRSSGEVVTVDRVSIVENEIRRCLQRSLEPIPEAMLDAAGYGGISLADVEHLTVRENVIEDNGPNYLEPVCGIFVLHGVGVDISLNRIVNNGATTAEGTGGAKQGPRGGIYIVGCMSPVPTGIDPRSGAPTALPALRVEENIVTVPLGRALTATALGSVSVHGNHLTTMGAVRAIGAAALLSPAAVKILDLGSSIGLGTRFINHTEIAADTHGPTLLRAGRDEAGMATLTALGRRRSRFGGDGRVLFSDNQVALGLLDETRAPPYSSIAIFSLDDVAFHDNQCTAHLAGGRMLSQVLLFGASLRASDNRLSEGLLDATYSGITLGFMNMTTDNQATHCLLILPHGSSLVVDEPNTILLGAINPEICDRFGQILGDFGTKLMKRGGQ